jgi:hypothetical protein
MSMALVAGISACNGAAPTVDAGVRGDALVVPSSPLRPPTGQLPLEAWLAQGHYRAWTCEQQISNRRLNGAHGRHRICSNQALLDSPSGPYPVGAASVKELFTATDQPNGYAVGLKVAEGDGEDSWYWYERIGSNPRSRPVADGVGLKICGAECHAAAPRDHVYIQAMP